MVYSYLLMYLLSSLYLWVINVVPVAIVYLTQPVALPQSQQTEWVTFAVPPANNIITLLIHFYVKQIIVATLYFYIQKHKLFYTRLVDVYINYGINSGQTKSLATSLIGCIKI